MRVTIHGSYGTGNRGDNIILSQLLRLLEEELPGAEVTILCRDVRRVALFLGAEFVDSVLRFTPLHVSFRKNPLKVLSACRNCDLFILGGGGLLWGRVPGNLSYWLQRPRVALLAGKRVIFYVPGIYGIEGRSAQKLLKKVGDRIDFLSVRDDEGFTQLVNAGVARERIIRGADPAFLLAPPQIDQMTNLVEALGLSGKKLIGLSARDWRSRLSAGIFAKFAHELLADENQVLLFFVFKSGGLLGETDTDDLNVIAALLRTLNPEQHRRVVIVDDKYSIAELINLIAACDYMIGMRLHSLIFATIAGTPFGAVAYDAKINAYMRMVGREDYMLSMQDVSDPDRIGQLTASLDRERQEADVAGPLPGITGKAVELSARAHEIHSILALKLREWFSAAPDTGIHRNKKD
ncbi:MAG: hypothetical protein GY835_26420 [bacterium]|nr:hypothetical protein [bacterium]